MSINILLFSSVVLDIDPWILENVSNFNVFLIMEFVWDCLQNDINKNKNKNKNKTKQNKTKTKTKQSRAEQSRKANKTKIIIIINTHLYGAQHERPLSALRGRYFN